MTCMALNCLTIGSRLSGGLDSWANEAQVLEPPLQWKQGSDKGSTWLLTNVNEALSLAQTLSSKQFESGRVLVDNEAEKELTVVTINERKDSTAALLDVASAMTGIGVLIHEAIIQVAFHPVTYVKSVRRCVPCH